MTTKFFFVKIRVRTRAHEPKRACARFVACLCLYTPQNVHARIYSWCARVCAQIFMKRNLIVTSYLMSLNFKFRKDPSFFWGDIPLFVTLYDLKVKILSFSKTKKNAILSSKKHTLNFIFFNFFFWWERWEVRDLPHEKNGLEIRLIMTSHE